MEIAHWTEDQRTLYWKQKRTEQLEIEEQANLLEKAKMEGEIRGEIKGEIKQVIQALKFKIEQEKFEDSLEYIKDNDLSSLIKYIRDGHLEDKAEEIGIALGLFDIDEEEAALELSGYTSDSSEGAYV